MKANGPIKVDPKPLQRPLSESTPRGIGQITRWEIGKRYLRYVLGRMARRLGYEYQLVLSVLKR